LYTLVGRVEIYVQLEIATENKSFLAQNYMTSVLLVTIRSVE